MPWTDQFLFLLNGQPAQTSQIIRVKYMERARRRTSGIFPLIVDGGPPSLFLWPQNFLTCAAKTVCVPTLPSSTKQKEGRRQNGIEDSTLRQREWNL
ncbi:hypothetical protein Mapa_013133 [Marchantia paleacea]|nr:hypothetical protein Mapa_013133 [Marchantia paleacea]